MKTLHHALATGLGLGLAPWAPGTFGSLGALPIHWALRGAHPLVYVAVVVGISVAGVKSAQVVSDDLADADPSRVVIDEVAGALIAMGLVKSRSVGIQVAAWLLFRLFDILKPGPIAKAEQVEPAGVGIMLDDIVAGGVAGLLARLLR